MNIRIYSDYEELSRQTAEMVIDIVNSKPDALLCFAAGNTQEGTYKHLIEAVRNGRVDFGRVRFVGLDEWTGMGREDDGSCTYFMYDRVFVPLNIPEDHIVFFNACAQDLDAECMRIDAYIRENGPIDLMLLGMGMNGHLGLNEPGIPFDLYSHVVKLDAVTQKVGQKYFDKPAKLEGGITLGIRHMLEARRTVLQINALKKADMTRKVVQGEISPDVPATAIRLHPDAYLLLDRDAAALLE